jgi:hypothetical protein
VLTFWPYVWQLDPGHTYDEHLILALKTGCDRVEAHQFRCSYEVRGRQFPLTPGARTGRQWRIEKWFSGALDEEKKGGKKTRGWETRFEDAEAWGAREQAATALCRGGRRDAGGCGPARFKIWKKIQIQTESNLFRSKDAFLNSKNMRIVKLMYN